MPFTFATSFPFYGECSKAHLPQPHQTATEAFTMVNWGILERLHRKKREERKMALGFGNPEPKVACAHSQVMAFIWFTQCSTSIELQHLVS